MPWEPVPLPLELAVIAMFPAVEANEASPLNPMLPAPVPPLMDVVAVTFPVVEKAAPMLIAWLALPVPPEQLEKMTATAPELAVVKDEEIFTP
jgi:hypothetical protein